MSLAYLDRVGPLSTCPGKFHSGNSEVVGARNLARCVQFFSRAAKNLGIKTPKLVLFELGTIAVCTRTRVLEYARYHLLIPIVIPAGYILRLHMV
jgi:hypothetical protein